MSKINKKSLNKYLKIIILLCITVILIKIIQMAFSRYKSEATSEQEIDIAYILLHEEKISDPILLTDLLPGNLTGKINTTNQQFQETKPAIYEFQVKNTDGTDRSEVNIEYTILFHTTTNLPLEYELYKNQAYDDTGATNLITSDTLERDNFGTYFRILSTELQTLNHENDQTDTYQLVVKFPSSNNSYLYSDVAESIELIIDAQEKI